MKTACASIALAAFSFLAGAAPPDASRIAIQAARLLDVRSGRYVERAVVVVRGVGKLFKGKGDTIESVGTSVPAGVPVVDLGDRTLLPGLIDTHTHILLQGDATQAEYEQQILKEYPAHRVARAVRAPSIR